jgi:hypothetical protein
MRKSGRTSQPNGTIERIIHGEEETLHALAMAGPRAPRHRAIDRRPPDKVASAADSRSILAEMGGVNAEQLETGETGETGETERGT